MADATTADGDDTAGNGADETTLVEGFIDFLTEYQIIGLGIAVVMGTATKDLVNAFVDELLMPIIEVLLPGEDWRSAVLAVGPVELGIGRMIGALLDFILIALIVYLIAKFILGREKVEKIK